MTSRTAPTQPPAALCGWRARVWSGVLFMALLKGLIPHAALASALMQGTPALVWCAPGLAAATGESKAAVEMSGASHACVCAFAGDGALLPGKVGPTPSGSTHDQPLARTHSAAIAKRLLLPPVRGPPAL